MNIALFVCSSDPIIWTSCCAPSSLRQHNRQLHVREVRHSPSSSVVLHNWHVMLIKSGGPKYWRRALIIMTLQTNPKRMGRVKWPAARWRTQRMMREVTRRSFAEILHPPSASIHIHMDLTSISKSISRNYFVRIEGNFKPTSSIVQTDRDSSRQAVE